MYLSFAYKNLIILSLFEIVTLKFKYILTILTSSYRGWLGQNFSTDCNFKYKIKNWR